MILMIVLLEGRSSNLSWENTIHTYDLFFLGLKTPVHSDLTMRCFENNAEASLAVARAASVSPPFPANAFL